MAKWELAGDPDLIPVPIPCDDFDKVLAEIADLLYSFACKSENQWLDQNQQNSNVDGKTTDAQIEKSVSVPVKPRGRSAS